MIEFRQKIFAKPRLPRFNKKEIQDWTVEKIKDTNPITTGVAAVGAGLGVANYRVNKQRRDADIELREDQIKATNELTDVLHRIEGLDEKEAKKHSRKLKKAFKKDIPEIEHPSAQEQIAKKTIFREKKNDRV